MDKWQACSVEHAILVVESMEWHGSLIVVHCHDSIEFAEVTAAEEFVCRVRTKRLDSLVSKVVDGRDDDFAFLFAATLFLVDARIQASTAIRGLVMRKSRFNVCQSNVVLLTILS